jgi:putative redox protein
MSASPHRLDDRFGGRIDLPADAEPAACAILAHGLSDADGETAAGEITRALAHHGIATLRIGRPDLEEAGEDAIVAAAGYLAGRFRPPALLVGHDLGGAAVLKASGRLPSVTAIATIAAPFDEEDAALRSALASLERPLLVLHGPEDETVGVEHAMRIFERAKHPKSFVSLDRADHLFGDSADAAYAGAVIAAWAGRYAESSAHQHESAPPTENRVVAVTGGTGYRTEIMANGHALVADEPPSVGGTNAGPTPYNLLAAALGACTGMTLRMYADRKQWPLTEVTVRLLHDKVHAVDCRECDEREGRIDRLHREIELQGPLDDAQRARLLEIADRCPVHRTLESDIRIETVLK